MKRAAVIRQTVLNACHAARRAPGEWIQAGGIGSDTFVRAETLGGRTFYTAAGWTLGAPVRGYSSAVRLARRVAELLR
jgi:hypothetical protein